MHDLNIATFQSNCYKTKKIIFTLAVKIIIAINTHMPLFSHYEMQIIVFFNLTIGVTEKIESFLTSLLLLLQF